MIKHSNVLRRIRIVRGLIRPLPLMLGQRLRVLLMPSSRLSQHRSLITAEGYYGAKLTAPIDDYPMHGMYFHGCFDWRNAVLSRALCKCGDRIIEVGANIGTETLYFAGVVGPTGQVIAFEPNPRNADLLSRNIHSNAFRHVLLRSIALGASPGAALFRLPSDEHNSGTGHILPEARGSAAGTLEVQCSTLDTEDLPKAAAIFIDVEGAECSVLEGGTRYLAEHRPALILEASRKHQRRAGRSLEDLALLIKELGYTIHVVGRWGLTTPLHGISDLLSGNWLCLPPQLAGRARLASRMLLRAYILPPIPGLNPLVPRRRPCEAASQL